MPQYRLTWSTDVPAHTHDSAHPCPDDRPGGTPSDGTGCVCVCVCTTELIEADRVDVEAGAWIVLRRTVHVVGRPREVVVRRVAASTLARVEEVPGS